MNKVITINLNGTAFQLEELGYSKLQDYLRIASEHLADDPDRTEILTDIEQAIADKCRKLINASINVISDAAIESIIREMGPVNASSDTPADETQGQKSPGTPKKLFRNTDDTIIGGVASGIAAYLGIEPVIVRLFFVIVSFFGGYGVLFYAILWLIVPAAKSSTDKISMRGDTVNIASLEKTVKEKVRGLKEDKGGVVSTMASGILGVLGNIIRWCGIIAFVSGKILVRIIGFFLFISFVIAIIGLTVGMVIVAFNSNLQYQNLPLQGIVIGWEYYLLLSTVYFLALAPLLYLMFAGQSLLMLKNSFNKSISLGLLAVWVVSLAFGGAMAIRLAPKIEARLADSPQPKIISREYPIKNFQGIHVDDAYSVSIIHGTTYAISASGREHDLDRLAIVNENGILSIHSQDMFRLCIFCFSGRTKVQITMPNLKSLNASDASSIVAGDFVGTAMDIELSNASRLELRGSAHTMALTLSGASRFSGKDFAVQDATITASGASHADVRVTKTLDAKLSGASHVNYWGEPAVTSDLSGSAHISPSTP